MDSLTCTGTFYGGKVNAIRKTRGRVISDVGERLVAFVRPLVGSFVRLLVSVLARQLLVFYGALQLFDVSGVEFDAEHLQLLRSAITFPINSDDVLGLAGGKPTAG